MVVYVTEETYASLQEIAALETRSVSNVAERKIIVGLRAGPDRTETDRSETAQITQGRTGQEELKSSVIEVLDNLPAESLAHLAEKLVRILDRSLPVQTGQGQTGQAQTVPEHIHSISIQAGQNPTVPEQTGSMLIAAHECEHSLTVSETERKKKIIKDVAIRLQEFIRQNNISQRGFRKIYDIDVTSLRHWISGHRGMSYEMIDRIESILSSSPVVV